MASIKISNLPSITGYTYNDVIPIVDSGSTQTSKITTGFLFNNTATRIADNSSTYTNTFIGAGSDVNSSSTESIFQGSTKYSGVMFGVGTLNNTSDSVILGSTGGGGGVSMDNSSASLMLGGFRSTLNNSTRSTNIVSQDWSLDNSLNSGALGGESGSITGCYKGWVIGSNNVSINNSTEGFVAGSRNSSIDLAGGNSGSIIGSKSSTISLPTPSAEINGIYSSDGITINTSGIQSVSLNSKSLTIGGSIQGATMVSVDGSNALHDWTLHTDNIHTFKTETFSVYDAGNVSGVVDVDCSLATIFRFTMVGDTTPNFINLRAGQRFIFIVYNNGSWAVPTAQINGATGNVFGKNGTLSPSNNKYTKYTATYDGTIMFLDEELNFSAV